MPKPTSVTLLGPAEIRDLAELLDVVPTKKLGQNFVHDPNTVRRIVQVAKVTEAEVVVEVGPGLGSLTLGILETGAQVVAVELDGRLAAQLPLTVAAAFASTGSANGPVPEPVEGVEARLTVIHEDALRIRELPVDPTVLVANLPYNVSVPVLLHFLETFPTLERGLVMVQAEVGQRVAAGPGSKVYGSPSVKAAWYGSWRTAGTVSRQIFWPVPNVDSILVGFERHPEPGTLDERQRTFALVDAAFGQRRKMLRQSLGPILGDSAAASAVLESAGIAPTARGEELTVDDYLGIARVAPAAAG